MAIQLNCRSSLALCMRRRYSFWNTLVILSRKAFPALLRSRRSYSYSCLTSFGVFFMKPYSCRIWMALRLTWFVSLTTSGSGSSLSISDLGISLGTSGLHRILMWVKARVNPSAEGSLSRNASCVLKPTRWFWYAFCRHLVSGSCLMTWSTIELGATISRAFAFLCRRQYDVYFSSDPKSDPILSR